MGGESDALWVNISQTSGVTAGRKAEWRSVASHTAQLEEGDGGFRKFIWEKLGISVARDRVGNGRRGRGEAGEERADVVVCSQCGKFRLVPNFWHE